MIELTERTAVPPDLEPTLRLTRDQRGRTRLRATLSDGREAAILLPRGRALRDGDGLASVDGLRVRVCAAAETLSRVECPDPLALARACYHLGNRHVALQIEPGRVSYLHDHVLDAMLAGLGLGARVVDAPFEPEPGAYGGQGHGHAHGHDEG
jgi:urease accessory protein